MLLWKDVLQIYKGDGLSEGIRAGEGVGKGNSSPICSILSVFSNTATRTTAQEPVLAAAHTTWKTEGAVWSLFVFVYIQFGSL